VILYGFLVFVGICTVFAFSNWRIGVLLWLAIAILQDPVRKATPATSVWLTVSFAPVYAATLYGMLREKQLFQSFYMSFPTLHRRFVWLLCCVVFSAGIGFFTFGSVMRSGIGMLSYFGGIPAVLVGMGLGLQNREKTIDRFLIAFIAFTSIFLVGVLLERFDVGLPYPILGTINSDAIRERRWFNDYDYVTMTAGFYRSSEIMGWHSIVMVLCCLYMALKYPKWNLLWGSLAVWGTYCALQSGRRKMLMVLVVFAILMYLFSGRFDRKRILNYVLPIALLMLVVLPMYSDSLYLMTFTSGLDKAASKLSEKGVEGPLWLIWIVGPFGYGVGAIAQGAQHFSEVSNVPLVEGGFEKVLVELGLVGTIVAFMVVYQMLLVAYRIVRAKSLSQHDSLETLFCFSFVIANGAAFLIAFQFLGDPFIASFVGLIYGVLLSFGTKQVPGVQRTTFVRGRVGPPMMRSPISQPVR
jgi:hypothetical protein